MSHIVIDILGLIFGCALVMVFLITALTYRELKIKKLKPNQDDSGWWVMNAYRDSAKAECERGLKNDDKTS